MGTTSSIKTLLFGDTAYFSEILEGEAKKLAIEYNNPSFKELFESLPHRSITVGPMSMCSRLAKDLGPLVNDEVLSALGMICFHISTHDDLIDEPLNSRVEKAALLYAGNVSFIEGVKRLHDHLTRDQVSYIMHEIERNHLLQQQCVEVLWDKRPKNFIDYTKGIEHDGALIGIGVRAALCLSGHEDLWSKLESMCTYYGFSLQILDDINEAVSDEKAGYISYPTVEGSPYRHSLKMVDEYINKEEELLDVEWYNFRELLHNVREVKSGMSARL